MDLIEQLEMQLWEDNWIPAARRLCALLPDQYDITILQEVLDEAEIYENSDSTI